MTAPSLPPRAASLHAVDRRTLLRGGIAGLGLAATPLGAAVATRFAHGVASGEPGPDRVLLWTRYDAGARGAVKLRWEVAERDDFARISAAGEIAADPEHDWCAKPLATGLEPGRWYYYRFVAPSGEVSPVGRTRTLPVGKIDAFRMAVFSCANLGFGWFNAYAHAAEDGRFDLAVHTGDYYYEYQRGEYPSAKAALPERVLWPANEIVSLADYRQRHATYRADPDLQRLFQVMPWIMVWDDHETANDSWKDGAENHQPESEGPWTARKAAALRAYREWLPVSDESWAAYDIGDLATLFRLETRLEARDKQFDFMAMLEGVPPAEVAARLDRFRDGAWRDPARTLLGARQEAWLAGALRASRRSGRTWQVLVQQVVMGALYMPPDIIGTLPAEMSEAYRRRIANRVAATREGLPFNMDAWDGYPAARERLLGAARAADANLVVLAGDSHNAWANNLRAGNTAVGVEFAGTSVTSPGFESALGWIPPERLARAAVAASPGLAWCDTARRGYLAVELTPARATGEFRFMDTVRQRSTRLSGSHALAAAAGRNRFV